MYSLYHGIVNAVQIFGVVNNIFTKGGGIKKSRRPCGGMRDFVGSDYFGSMSIVGVKKNE
ncbi:MAG: hypothetical protein BHW37_01740 [Firmicutes bacterium CAG:272_52_7]|nr:MAG: hypothetical protein BHW37_01740 [Firmicutes bacterium CAG:272_52_7]